METRAAREHASHAEGEEGGDRGRWRVEVASGVGEDHHQNDGPVTTVTDNGMSLQVSATTASGEDQTIRDQARGAGAVGSAALRIASASSGPASPLQNLPQVAGACLTDRWPDSELDSHGMENGEERLQACKPEDKRRKGRAAKITGKVAAVLSYFVLAASLSWVVQLLGRDERRKHESASVNFVAKANGPELPGLGFGRWIRKAGDKEARSTSGAAQGEAGSPRLLVLEALMAIALSTMDEAQV